MSTHPCRWDGVPVARIAPACSRSVSVRVRPLNKQEQNEGFTWRIEGNSMFQIDPVTREPDRARDAKYTLDHVFGPNTTTTDIYRTTTQHLIQKLVSGFNSTVFAYGQTSSGKTYTMRGTSAEPGIISLAVREVFSIIEQTVDREFLLRVSYMEVSMGKTGFPMKVHAAGFFGDSARMSCERVRPVGGQAVVPHVQACTQ